MFSHSSSFRSWFFSYLSLALLLFTGFAYAGKDPIYTGRFSNLAVSGYDTVAYFTQSEAVKGDAQFSTEWQGAEWRFSTAENLAAFTEEPEKYAPQYGGYCAYAAASDKAVSADPKQWAIHNDKLYLNYNKRVREDWLQDKEAYIEKADRNWPGLLD